MRKIPAVLIILLLLIADLSASEIAPRIHIFPLKNMTGEAAYENICTTIDQFITMTLTLIGKYEVTFNNDSGDNTDTLENLKSYAEQDAVDNIIFGTLIRNDENDIEITVSLFDGESGTIPVVLTDTAFSIFDIFDVSENLISKLISSFSDIHIGFGSVFFNNTGEQGRYEVYFDRTHAGPSIEEIEKVLNGDYLIEIKQERFGKEITLYSRMVSIREDMEKEIIFSIPFLTEEERLRIRTLEEEVDNILKDKSLETEYSAITRLVNLIADMEDLQFCPSLEIIRSSLIKKQTLMTIEFALRKNISTFNRGETISEENILSELHADMNNDILSAGIRANEYAFFLNKLKALILLADRNFTEYFQLIEFMHTEDKMISEEFSIKFEEDSKYIEILHNHYIQDKKPRSKRELFSTLEEYYQDIWDYVSEVKKKRGNIPTGDLILNKNSLEQLFVTFFGTIQKNNTIQLAKKEDENKLNRFCFIADIGVYIPIIETRSAEMIMSNRLNFGIRFNKPKKTYFGFNLMFPCFNYDYLKSYSDLSKYTFPSIGFFVLNRLNNDLSIFSSIGMGSNNQDDEIPVLKTYNASIGFGFKRVIFAINYLSINPDGENYSDYAEEGYRIMKEENAAVGLSVGVLL